MGTEKIIDPSTNGGKLRAARKAAKKSLAEIGGYNVGYLSRVERNFLPVSTGVLASYEEAVGHRIDVTPEATVAPKRARKRGKQLDRAAFIAQVTQWMREQLQKGMAPVQGQEGVAYLLGFIDGAGAFLGPGVSQTERDILEGVATALCRLDGRGWQGGIAGGIGALVFQEHLVVQTARTLIDSDIANLEEALDSLRECCLAYEVIYRADAPRYTVFSVDPTHPQSVIFRAMHDREQLWRTETRQDTIPYNSQEADLVRSWLHLAAAFLSPPVLTEQAALAQTLPCGPYQTFRGPMVVRWNNTCCHERCPLCNCDFKPAWGFWAFLYGLGGPVLCLDCWRKGPQINALDESRTIPAVTGHLHVLDPDDSQGYSGYCSLCGAHWTIAEGWWRRDATGTWRREVQASAVG
jgi:transcriptional regulator with XRE-family HTH domain